MEEHAQGTPDPDAPAPGSGLVVPIEDVPAMQGTIHHALDRLEPEETLHLVAIAHSEDPEDTLAVEALTTRAEGWAREAQLDPSDITIETTVLPITSEQPSSYATLIAQHARAHNARRVILPPSVALADMHHILDDLVDTLEQDGIQATIASQTREQYHRPLTVPGSRAAFAALFTATFIFYLLISGSYDAFTILTGIPVAGIVTIVFHRVTFTRSPPLPHSLITLIRWILYAPYLLYQIVKANLHVASLILHPRLPLDPRLDRYRCSLESEIARVTLANSITLTPGTLSVEVRGNIFYVHSLVPEATARDLAIAVTYVFQGREGLQREDPWRPLATDEVIAR